MHILREPVTSPKRGINIKVQSNFEPQSLNKDILIVDLNKIPYSIEFESVPTIRHQLEKTSEVNLNATQPKPAMNQNSTPPLKVNIPREQRSIKDTNLGDRCTHP